MHLSFGKIIADSDRQENMLHIWWCQLLKYDFFLLYIILIEYKLFEEVTLGSG